jgi:hypothetical protein
MTNALHKGKNWGQKEGDMKTHGEDEYYRPRREA